MSLYRPYILIPLFLISIIATAPAVHAEEDVIFVCAQEEGATSTTRVTTEEPGLFRKFVNFLFRRTSPTIVTIDCRGTTIPLPIKTATGSSTSVTTSPTTHTPQSAPPVRQGGIFNAVRNIFSSSNKTSTQTNSATSSTNTTTQPTKSTPTKLKVTSLSEYQYGTSGNTNTSVDSEKNDQLRAIQKELTLVQKEIKEIESQVRKLEEAQYISPYYGRVKVSLRKASGIDPNTEIITIKYLRATADAPRLPLSTFTLANAYGEKFSIPGATPAPMPGASNEKAPLLLYPGETVIIVTGSSPNGLSFQTNSCTGYFSKGTRFNPGLAVACPTLISEAWATKLHPSCRDYISRIGRCQIPTIPTNLRPECQEAIAEHASYNACFNAHKNDPDFYKGEWRVFLNRNEPIFSYKYEEAALLDANGKYVWYYAY